MKELADKHMVSGWEYTDLPSCPVCGAEVGAQCRLANGDEVGSRIHEERGECHSPDVDSGDCG